MKSLNLSDFIVAIILGMVICNTVGVHAVFRDGLRFSTTLTKTGIVVMGCKYSFAGLIKTRKPSSFPSFCSPPPSS